MPSQTQRRRRRRRQWIESNRIESLSSDGSVFLQSKSKTIRFDSEWSKTAASAHSEWYNIASLAAAAERQGKETRNSARLLLRLLLLLLLLHELEREENSKTKEASEDRFDSNDMHGPGTGLNWTELNWTETGEWSEQFGSPGRTTIRNTRREEAQDGRRWFWS